MVIIAGLAWVSWTQLHSVECRPDSVLTRAAAYHPVPEQPDRHSLKRCGTRLTEGSPVAAGTPTAGSIAHWDHIAISNFARDYLWSSESTKDSDREWLAGRVDLIEGNSASDPYTQAMRRWNPTLAVFQYRLDHYDFVNDQSHDILNHMCWPVNQTTLFKEGKAGTPNQR